MKKIKAIKIRAFMGHEDLELDMDSKRVIALGKNGIGKTSLINAIKAGVAPGYPVEMIKDGAEEGEIGIVFEDMSVVQKLISRQKKSGAYGKFQYIDADGLIVSKDTGYFKNLDAHFAFDPGAIVNAEGNELQEILMKALPLEANPEDFKSIFKAMSISEFKQVFGSHTDTKSFVDNILQKHPLEAIGIFHQGLYSFRKSVNAKESQATKTVKQLEQTLPKENIDFTSKIAELRELAAKAEQNRKKALQDINSALNEELQRISEVESEEVALMEHRLEKMLEANEEITSEDIRENTAAYDKDIEKIEDQIKELEKQLAGLKATKQIAIEKLQEAYRAEKLRIKQLTEENISDKKRNAAEDKSKARQESERLALQTDTETDKLLYELNSELRILEEKQKTVEQTKAQRQIAEKLKQEAAELKNQSGKYTELLEKISKVKEHYLENIPIKKLDFKDGEFYYDGKRAATCSTGEKMLLASEISALFAEKTGFGFVMWDNLDHLDEDNLQQAYRIFEQKGIQLIGALVSSDEELKFVN